MKALPIGISNFKEIIEKNYYYVDKTLLIKELITLQSKVTLLPRPRRFGKTLNLSMLHHFFSNTRNSGHLFENTAVARHKEIMSHQGMYPVIFLTFKDVKEETWEYALEKIALLLMQEFESHSKQLFPILSEREQEHYNSICTKKASEVELSSSLKFLSELLYRYYGKQVVILIDEYDAPIHAGFQYDYYKKMVFFIRNLFSGALKDNEVLAFGVLTGILRTAKEGIFSGLNNLYVASILNKEYSTFFGFTQLEVDNLLIEFDVQQKSAHIKEWYNGYQFAEITMYNPWSMLMCMSKGGELMPYWANTSDNALIKKLLLRAPVHMQMQLEQLLQNKTISHILEEAFVFPTMESNETTLWSLLVFSGYLTTHHKKLVGDEYEYELAIPNKEVRLIYRKFLQEALIQPLKLGNIRMLYESLSNGDGDLFQEIVQEYVLNSVSMFDLPAQEPEKSYHLFVLGLLVSLSDVYEIISNRESGFGRYDIMIVPKDIHQRGIIIEFKRAKESEELVQSAQQALEQIQTKKYAVELNKRGITIITAFGVAFKGKKVALKQQEL